MTFLTGSKYVMVFFFHSNNINNLTEEFCPFMLLRNITYSCSVFPYLYFLFLSSYLRILLTRDYFLNISTHSPGVLSWEIPWAFRGHLSFKQQNAYHYCCSNNTYHPLTSRCIISFSFSCLTCLVIINSL